MRLFDEERVVDRKNKGKISFDFDNEVSFDQNNKVDNFEQSNKVYS